VLNLATAIKEEWLRELFPEDFREVHAVVYDPTLRRVVVRDETRFRDLVLEEKLSDNPPAEEAAKILAREVTAGRCALQNWNEAVEQWILRVNRLREWMPELALPAIGEEDRDAMSSRFATARQSQRNQR
jgi:ATP-dependent helicase HrpB